MVRKPSLFFVSFANSHYHVSGYDILGYRALTQAGIYDRNYLWRDLVGKISPSFDRIREVGIESDLVVAHWLAHKMMSAFVPKEQILRKFRFTHPMPPRTLRQSPGVAN